MFRKCLITDLKLSDRLRASGLERVMFDLVKYSFSGKPFIPPVSSRAYMNELIDPAHSLCKIKVRGVKVLHV